MKRYAFFKRLRFRWPAYSVAVALILILTVFQNCQTLPGQASRNVDSRSLATVTTQTEVNAASVPDVASGESCQQIVASGRKVMVALILGQSNAANFADAPGPTHSSVFSFFNGTCEIAQDPLLSRRQDGAGHGGSVWTRLGPQLVQSGLYDKVIFVPIAVGGSPVSSWARGEQAEDLTHALGQLQIAGLAITHVFYHQGERDNLLGTTTEAYRADLESVISGLRSRGVSAPIFISLASFRPGPTNRTSRAVQLAQLQVLRPDQGIWPGPNTDKLTGAEYRSAADLLHFSTNGAARVADLWLERIREAEWPDKVKCSIGDEVNTILRHIATLGDVRVYGMTNHAGTWLIRANRDGIIANSSLPTPHAFVDCAEGRQIRDFTYRLDDATPDAIRCGLTGGIDVVLRLSVRRHDSDVYQMTNSVGTFSIWFDSSSRRYVRSVAAGGLQFTNCQDTPMDNAYVPIWAPPRLICHIDDNPGLSVVLRPSVLTEGRVAMLMKNGVGTWLSAFNPANGNSISDVKTPEGHRLSACHAGSWFDWY